MLGLSPCGLSFQLFATPLRLKTELSRPFAAQLKSCPDTIYCLKVILQVALSKPPRMWTV